VRLAEDPTANSWAKCHYTEDGKLIHSVR
jgi:hypothetical protein